MDRNEDLNSPDIYLKGLAEYRHFIKGPIPLWWFERAAALPCRAALCVGVCLWYQFGYSKGREVKLTSVLLKNFKVPRSTKFRALRELENAGLVDVKRQRGKNPLVTLVLRCKCCGGRYRGVDPQYCSGKCRERVRGRKLKNLSTY